MPELPEPLVIELQPFQWRAIIDAVEGTLETFTESEEGRATEEASANRDLLQVLKTVRSEQDLIADSRIRLPLKDKTLGWFLAQLSVVEDMETDELHSLSELLIMPETQRKEAEARVREAGGDVPDNSTAAEGIARSAEILRSCRHIRIQIGRQIGAPYAATLETLFQDRTADRIDRDLQGGDDE